MNLKLKTAALLLALCALCTGQEITFMTYNIKYANETDGVNSWSQRKQDLSKQITYYAPDILGMQEVILEQKNFLLSEIPYYSSLGVARDDGKDKGEFSPVFYNSEKLIPLESGTFWLSENPEMPGKSWDAAFPRICTYGKFSFKNQPETEFWVLNTHFDHVGVEARKNSLKLIIDKINELNKENLPLVIMGDFNLNSDSREIQDFIRDMKSYYPDFNDSYNTGNYGPKGTFNGYSFPAEMPRIDFIFSSGLEIKNHRIIEDKRSSGLWHSDHLPVMIKAVIQH